MKKIYDYLPETQLSDTHQLRHVKCIHHKGYLTDDLSMIKSGFYELSYCKSGDLLLRIGQKRYFITNGDILVIPPDLPHYIVSSDLVANYYDFITIWLEKSYITNLKDQLPALEESVLISRLPIFCIPLTTPMILRKLLNGFTGNMQPLAISLRHMPAAHPPVFW